MGVTLIVVSTRGAGVTVSCTGGAVTPWELAVRVTVPPPCATPVAVPRFWPSLLMAFTVAMFGLELTHVNVSPDIGRSNWSNPVTANDVELPAGTVAVNGVTVIVVNVDAGLVVVSVVLALIPCEEAVMVLVPPVGPPAPVANPVALMVAALWLLLANVNVIPLIRFPYWSTPLAAYC